MRRASGTGAVEVAAPLDPREETIRSEIVRSGRRTQRLRLLGAVVGVMTAPALLLGLLLWLRADMIWAWDPASLLSLLSSYGILALLGLGVGGAVGVPTSIALLRERRRFARRQLAKLPRKQQIEMLLSLRNERGDTRRIVAPLLREFGIPAEITPASPSEGRGSELS